MEENKNLNEQLPEEKFPEEPTFEAETEPAPEAAPAPAPAPKKKKKVGLILGIIAAVIVVVIVAVILITTLSGNKDFTRASFINEIGGTSETYTATVSERTFDSAESAAEEFVLEEICYSRYDTTINNVTSKGTVDASGIIPEELLVGSESVEKLEVEYSNSSYASVGEGPMAASSYDPGKSEVVEVYVVRYGDGWRYVTPIPIKGQVLNESYLTSVFSSDKFQNCTFEIEEKFTMGIFGFNLSETNVKWIVKKQENRLYFEQTVSNGGFIKEPDTVMCFYLEEDESGSSKLYEKTEDGQWVYRPYTALGFYGGAYRIDDVDDYSPFFDHQHFPNTYFNKTDYGFEVSKDMTRGFFLSTYFWKEFTSILRQEQMYIYDEDVTVKDLYAEYFVQDGALTGARSHSKVDFKAEFEGIEITFNYTDKYTAKITDYGNTVVERPVD